MFARLQDTLSSHHFPNLEFYLVAKWAEESHWRWRKKSHSSPKKVKSFRTSYFIGHFNPWLEQYIGQVEAKWHINIIYNESRTILQMRIWLRITVRGEIVVSRQNFTICRHWMITCHVVQTPGFDWTMPPPILYWQFRIYFSTFV
jgi:hypothetical protein